jgi:hypothetical protein
MRGKELFLVVRIISMNFIFPAIIYTLFSTKTSELNAILLSGIPPFIDAVLHVLMERKMDAINGLAICGTVVGVLFAYFTNDPKMAR